MNVGLYAVFTPGMPGGCETYIRELITALSQITDDRIRCSLFVSEANRHIFEHLAPHLRTVLYRQQSLPIRVFRRALNELGLSVGPLSYPYRRKHGVDLMHFLSSTLDRWADVPCVLTLHDLQHEFFPQFFSKKELRARRMYFPISVEKAIIIICVSRFTKETLIARYGVREEKIRVIYEGVSTHFRKPVATELITEVKAKYGLGSGHLLFYPARTWPHKNHIRLLESLAILRDRYNCKAKLILTGGIEHSHQEVMEAVDRFRLNEDVKHLGLVPYTELPAIYKLADALIFPSLFEGFGIPILEAMSIGCPVICSNVASVPEVAGDAAVYFDPLDVESMANAVYRVLHEPNLRKKMIEKGLERSKQFSWEKTAKATLEVYREALGLI